MPEKPTLVVEVAATPVPLLRTSERRDFKRCPQRWSWAWRHGLRANDVDLKLWFGTCIHEALAHYYGHTGVKRNKDMIDVFRAVVADDLRFIRSSKTGDWDDSEYVEAGKLGEAMLLGYIKEYQGDRNWDIIYTEEPFQINIPDANGNILVTYSGTFDGVYRDRDSRKVYLIEHKTAATISLGHLQIDDQAGSYWAVATDVLRSKGVLLHKESIHGITYNFLRKALPDDRARDAEGYCLNKDGSRSKAQPKPLFVRHEVLRTPRERQTQLVRIQSEATLMDLMRRGEVPLFKNPTRDCAWDCQFYQMCELHEMQSDWQEFRDAVFHVRDPYADHRKSASGGS